MDNSSKTYTATSKRPKLRKNDGSFASNVLMLVGGTAFAQALTILASPILTRLYGPEDFGLYALFISITGIITVVACMRYELAIMLPDREDDAVNLLGVSLLLSLITSILTFLAIWIAREPLLRLLNAIELAPYLWFVPLAVFVGGAFNALNYWNTRTKHFGQLSVARITRSVATTGTQIGTGLAGYATGGNLIGGGITGSTASILVLVGKICHDECNIRKKINLNIMVMVLKRYRKFPMIDLWSALLNTISWQIPVLLLSAFFSSAVVGFYALGFRVIHIPMNFIGSAIAQVFIQRAVEANANGSLSDVVEKVVHVLVICSLLPMLILTINGKEIFIFIFGDIWAEAGIYTQFLGLWAFIWLVSSPISTLYVVLEKQEFGLKLNTINFITRFVSIYVGGILQNVYVAIALFALSGVVVYGYLLITLFNYAGISKHTLLQILSSNLVKLIPACSILLALKLIGTCSSIQVITSGILIVSYYIYIIKADPLINGIIANLDLVGTHYGFLFKRIIK